MSENTPDKAAAPEPETGGEVHGPPSKGRWVSIIKEVETPIKLLALVALIASALLGTILAIGLPEPTQSIIAIVLAVVLVGLLVGIVVVVARHWTPPVERPPLEPPKGPVVDSPPPQPDDDGEGPKRDIILNAFATNPMIPSELPVMVMTAPDLVVRKVSRSAMRYFGYATNAPADTVVGKKVTKLIEAMAPFMDPPSAFWADLGKDQERVINEVMAGRITYARVPVRLNEKHPEFPNKTFVPIITERSTLDETGDSRMVLRVLYVDVERLPKNLFTMSVWEDVIKNLDRQELVSELRSVKDEFDRRPFKKDKDHGETRRKALDDAIQKLEKYSSPAVLDDLSKAGWFELRDTASTMQNEPRKVVRLIEKVLGPDAHLGGPED